MLRKYGFEVTHSHIDEGGDFFQINNLEDYDAIVSNPPFSKRDAIFEKIFKTNVPFALIGNMNGIFDSKRRWKLFKDNEFELIVPKGRMKFISGDASVRSSTPTFQSVYVCRGMAENTIEFVEAKERQ